MKQKKNYGKAELKLGKARNVKQTKKKVGLKNKGQDHDLKKEKEKMVDNPMVKEIQNKIVKLGLLDRKKREENTRKKETSRGKDGRADYCLLNYTKTRACR